MEDPSLRRLPFLSTALLVLSLILYGCSHIKAFTAYLGDEDPYQAGTRTDSRLTLRMLTVEKGGIMYASVHSKEHGVPADRLGEYEHLRTIRFREPEYYPGPNVPDPLYLMPGFKGGANEGGWWIFDYATNRNSGFSMYERVGNAQRMKLNGLTLRTYVAPLWFVALVSGLYPAFWFARFARARIVASQRTRHGLCLQCGYDLQGSTSERCPECGTEFAS